MRVIVAVNHVSEIVYRQTTSLLIASLVRDCHEPGYEVHLADVDAFSFHGGEDRNRYFVHSLKLTADPEADSNSIEAIARSRLSGNPIEIRPGDLILIRTNPGRDLHRGAIHATFLEFCRCAQSADVRVINDPRHLRFFANKASLAMIPTRFRPAMMFSHDAGLVADFVNSSVTDCVIKPMSGSRGENVIRVSAGQADLVDLITEAMGNGGVVAQHFVDSDPPGDQRILVLGGKILESDGHIAGISRRPAAGDFRANIHAGGTAHPVDLSADARSAVEFAAELLNQNGILLAGIDVIGEKIIEFNVFSTGGLFFANQFAGVDFSESIVDRLIQQVNVGNTI